MYTHKDKVHIYWMNNKVTNYLKKTEDKIITATFVSHHHNQQGGQHGGQCHAYDNLL